MIIDSKLIGQLAIAGAMLLLSVSPAAADPMVIFDHDVRTLSTAAFPNTTAARNSFLTQVTSLVGTPYQQTFPAGTPTGTNPSFGFPGSTITATTTNLTFQFVTFFGVNDTNNGSASSALIESEVASGTGTTAQPNSIDFSQPINAFGLYVCQVGDVLGHPITFRIENTLVPGSTRDIVIDVGPNWQAYSISYLGIIDTASAFNRFTMIENTDVDNNGTSDDLQDGIIFDNLTIAAVPALINPVTGDFDSDGKVDGIDLAAWQNHFPAASGGTLAGGDADGDGDVDGADFVVWQTHYSPGSNVASVPEPQSVALLIAALIVFGAQKVVRKR